MGISERKVLTCPHCKYSGEDVISYLAHIGGNAAPQKVTHCEDIVKCLERQKEALCTH